MIFNIKRIAAFLAVGVLSITAFEGSDYDSIHAGENISSNSEDIPVSTENISHPSEEVIPEKMNIGTFKTKDINGNEYTEKLFSDYDLTMVNVFTTWCSPCVEELPYLQQLSEEMQNNKNSKVQVIGIVLDSAGKDGKTDETVLDKAQTLQSEVQITYPLLIPDSQNMNGRLKEVQSVPENFFVDSRGNIVGETYSGSHTLNEWREIINEEMKNLNV